MMITVNPRVYKWYLPSNKHELILILGCNGFFSLRCSLKDVRPRRGVILFCETSQQAAGSHMNGLDDCSMCIST